MSSNSSNTNMCLKLKLIPRVVFSVLMRIDYIDWRTDRHTRSLLIYIGTYIFICIGKTSLEIPSGHVFFNTIDAMRSLWNQLAKSINVVGMVMIASIKLFKMLYRIYFFSINFNICKLLTKMWRTFKFRVNSFRIWTHKYT